MKEKRCVGLEDKLRRILQLIAAFAVINHINRQLVLQRFSKADLRAQAVSMLSINPGLIRRITLENRDL